MKWLYLSGIVLVSGIYLFNQVNPLVQTPYTKLVGPVHNQSIAGIPLQNLSIQLDPGMILSVDADLKDGGAWAEVKEASAVVALKGVVVSNDLDLDASINILGQHVFLHEDLVFSSFSKLIPTVDKMPVGSYVHVSGFSTGNGKIVATRIEVIDGKYKKQYELLVSGFVKNLSQTSFTIGDLSIDYGLWHEKFAKETLSENQYVVVKSHVKPRIYDTENPSLLALQLERFENKSAQLGGPGKLVKLEGIVAEIWIEKNELILNGHRVRLQVQMAKSRLKGKQVALEGKIDLDGYILAQNIQILKEQTAPKLTSQLSLFSLPK